jgi:hypothetical protein
MPGALIDLAAKGLQDVYLTSDPQITYFKIVYRRHTNFSIESVPLSFVSEPNFGSVSVCPISRSGDLLGKLTLAVNLPTIPKFTNIDGTLNQFKKVAWIKNIGFYLIKEMIFEVNGQTIDTRYGEWLYIWSQLTQNAKSIDPLIGNEPILTTLTNGKAPYQLLIPLEFYFTRNPGLYFPLVSLNSDSVKIIFKFRSLNECLNVAPTNSILIMEDICPFDEGDYIVQYTAGDKIFGQVVGFDYVAKRLFYTKIKNGSNNPIDQFTSATLEPNLSLNRFIARSNDPFNVYLNEINSFVSSRIYSYNDPNPIIKYVTPQPGSIETKEKVTLTSNINLSQTILYADYVYLDTGERARFLNNVQEYLIEQVQLESDQGIGSSTYTQVLNFKNPCKAIYWVGQMQNVITATQNLNQHSNYTNSFVFDTDKNKYTGKNLTESAELDLDGKSIFGTRSSSYFNLIEPLEHHSNSPATGINMFSFSLAPEKVQPSGTMNMSKINRQTLKLRLNSVTQTNPINIRTYALSYNLFRIMYGIAGLIF